MKKRIALVMALCMTAMLTACGGDSQATTAAPATTAAQAETTAAEETTAAPATEAATTAASGQSGDKMSIDEACDKAVAALSLNPEDFADLEPVTLTVASSAASANFGYTVMTRLADAIKEQTGGKLSFDIVWDGTLGNDNELTESCEAGDIDIVFESTSSLANYIPESAIFDMPGLFTSVEEANEACRAFLDTWNEICAPYDLVALDLTCPMFRAFSSSKEVNTPDDFKGISVRCAENKYYQAFYSNLGMSPTPLAYSELYMSLSQGLVDAQDNPISVIYAAKFYEVQSVYMELNAISYASNLVMNKTTYDSLDPAYQDALKQFAVQFYNGEIDGQPAADQEAFDAIGDGMKVLPVTEEIQAAIVAAGEPVWDMVAQDIGQEVVDKYLACAGR
ncbi:TRAP transporter substrate-binding protein [Hominifimenecus sp. rT4P-3]|uniref:TRAP transporter substrate-binding protein n=1 Tax=Hominifimenecus sp. rT4P-3 TaxID=3242979 RepID=UPI003DA6B6ED